MSIDEFLRYFPGTQVTDEQIACCHLLQKEGQRFGDEFSLQDAVSKAFNLIDSEFALKFSALRHRV